MRLFAAEKTFSLDNDGVMAGTSMHARAKGLTSMLAAVPRSGGLARRGAKKLRAGAVLGSCVAALGVVAVCAAAQRESRPAAGRAVRETRRMATIHWEQVPLRDALARLPALFGEPVFVDRRVDPNQRISLDVAAASVDDVLAPVAASLSLGTSRLGTLRYLGPRTTAEQLRTVAAVRRDEAVRLPVESRASLTRRQRLTWPRLTEPRGLVTALTQERGWRVEQAERIPHDLWPAGSLPALTLVEQLTVLLAGFDLTFRAMPNGRTIEIVPLGPTTITRRYRLPDRLAEPESLLQQQLPDLARVEIAGETISVDGRLEDHERLIEILRGPATRGRPPAPVRETRQVYTLRVVEQPVGAVLRQLAERLAWQLEIDETAIRAAGLSLERRVSFSVENSDQDELLKAVLHPAGLDYRREGERLRIVPGN